MSNIDLRSHLIAAVAALAVSATVVLGTVGPVQATNPEAGATMMLADSGVYQVPSAVIA